MISAAHHTLMGPDTGIKLPYDWSYDTVMDQRDALAAKVTRNSTPTVTDTYIDLSALGVAQVLHHPVPLIDYPGKVGMAFRFSDEPAVSEYCIVDPEVGTVTRTGAKMTITSSNVNTRLCLDRYGKMCGVVRYDGGVYSFGQDGSNCTKHGTCEAFPTNRGFRLVQIPEGGFIAYGEESTTRHMYKIDDNYNPSLAYTWDQTSYYPYSAIFMPDYLVITITLGTIQRFKRDLSSGTRLSTVTYGSYISLAGMTMCPLTRGDIFFGMSGNKYSSKKLVGYKVGTNAAVLSTTLASSNGTGENTGCFLPTGEFFSHVQYDGNNTAPVKGNQWYLYNYETDTFTNVGGTHDGTTAVGWRVCMLPTGKCLSYRNNIGNDGKIYFKFHDWGFKKKDIPANLISGPFGFNNTCC
jgi:hypothetical protein